VHSVKLLYNIHCVSKIGTLFLLTTTESNQMWTDFNDIWWELYLRGR